MNISTFQQIPPPHSAENNRLAIDRGDTTAIGGDILYSTQEYLHQFWTNFEHNIAHGGGSGDSGGIFL
jgi:hypothetical protein